LKIKVSISVEFRSTLNATEVCERMEPGEHRPERQSGDDGDADDRADARERP
jgi:hypothetical protein